jgi:cell wall-associated NlpC family hydrolase
MPVEDRISFARSLLGTQFRLHGRDPASGLDCVGLIALVHNRLAFAPTGYALRNSCGDQWQALLDAAFTRRWSNVPQPGDVIVTAPAPNQQHLGIWTGASLIHAHAGLRKVVETPGAVDAPIIGIWFAPEVIS